MVKQVQALIYLSYHVVELVQALIYLLYHVVKQVQALIYLLYHVVKQVQTLIYLSYHAWSSRYIKNVLFPVENRYRPSYTTWSNRNRPFFAT